MPPNHFESEVESFLEGSHGDRTHIKRADHHTVTPLCGTLLDKIRPASSACVESAIFFAQRSENRPKRPNFAVQGEFCRGACLIGGLLGEFFRGGHPPVAVLGEFFRGAHLPLGALGEFCRGTLPMYPG